MKYTTYQLRYKQSVVKTTYVRGNIVHELANDMIRHPYRHITEYEILINGREYTASRFLTKEDAGHIAFKLEANAELIKAHARREQEPQDAA